jgi:hypothetical protein
VATPRGLVPIEQLVAGDLVLTAGDSTGDPAWGRITTTFSTPDQNVLELELVDAASGTRAAIQSTGEHPYFVRHRGWAPAHTLLPGDEVFTSRGGWLRVAGATWIAAKQAVYNLEVGTYHSYFVGEVGAWVHNQCPPSAPRLRELDIERYGSFSGGKNRKGDALAGHEVLQNAWLKQHGLAGRRGSGSASRDNPALAVGKELHDAIGARQRALGLNDPTRLRSMTARENIELNARALREAGVPDHAVQTIVNEAVSHARGLGVY